ncbi:MAG: primosomal protein N', partial [bacterium]
DEKGIELALWISQYFHSTLYSAIRLLFWDLKTFRIETEYTINDQEAFFEYIHHKVGLFGKPKRTTNIDSLLTKRQLKSLLKSCDVYPGEQDKLIDDLFETGLIRPSYHLEKGKVRVEKTGYLPDENPPVDSELTQKEEEIYLAISDWNSPVTWEELKDQFPKGRRQFTSILKKGFLVESHIAKHEGFCSDESKEIKLTREQVKATDEINYSIEHDLSHSFLLEGVTGSGKTEVYLECAKKALNKGSIIVLVPEIVLTLQIVQRFKHHFGNELFVLHSGLGQSRLKRNWEVLRGSKNRIVIGPRSALFAPLTDVKLIIIDEEHEPAYKQERSPRYHARDVARKMASLRNATLVLGSATPSIESRYLAEKETYKLLELTKRIFKGGLPKVEMLSLTSGPIEGPHYLTSRLVNELRSTLDKGKQALLFLNQRGFSPSLVCASCGYTPKCKHCDISYTYHSRDNLLLCHHCDSRIPYPRECQICGGDRLLKIGFGTQRVEEDVAKYFPDADIYRLDRDIASRGGIDGGGQAVMKNFFENHGDILIGTQMIGKGLDLPDVELVGVISADTSLNIPDFRAAERTFQLITQVAGRAGRRDIKGLVILQSYKHGHYAIECARMQDFELFYEKEIEMRRIFNYPPFSNLARILFRGSEHSDVREQIDFAVKVLNELQHRKAIHLMDLMGPCPAPLGRIAGKFRHHIILKAKNVSMLIDAIDRLENRMNLKKGVWMDVDINPINMM